MANPTAAQLAQIRHHVPAEWTPTEKFSNGKVFAAFQQYGTVNATALALSRLKLAHMIEGPDTFSVSGEYSQSNASGVAALRAQVIRLQTLVEADLAAVNRVLVVDLMVRVGGPRR